MDCHLNSLTQTHWLEQVNTTHTSIVWHTAWASVVTHDQTWQELNRWTQRTSSTWTDINGCKQHLLPLNGLNTLSQLEMTTQQLSICYGAPNWRNQVEEVHVPSCQASEMIELTLSTQSREWNRSALSHNLSAGPWLADCCLINTNVRQRPKYEWLFARTSPSQAFQMQKL